MRADAIEGMVTQDLKGLFRDSQYVGQICDEGRALMAKEKPQAQQELTAVERQLAKVSGRRERCLEAFEAGSLKAQACGEKLKELNAQIAGLRT